MKTSCSKKCECLNLTSPDFDFGFCGKTRLSTLGNPSSKWISIKKFTSGSHGFLCFAFFRVIQKGSPLGRVSMRWTVGYKTKKEIGFGFFNGNPSWVQIFRYWNPFLFSFFTIKSVFRNFNSDLLIESTQNFRAVFPIFHMYPQLFWTLLNRNKIILT